MDKLRLKELLNEFNGDETEFYNIIVTIDKEKSSFSKYYSHTLLLLSLYLYHCKFGIDHISK